MLVDIFSDSGDYFGDLESWLEKNIEPDERATIRETLERGCDYVADDETHGVYLTISRVDLSVYG